MMFYLHELLNFAKTLTKNRNFSVDFGIMKKTFKHVKQRMIET